jgi:hypothetical protein
MSLDVYLSLPPCAHCGHNGIGVFSANVTHNLTKMANEAGIYYALWRPEEIGAKTAGDIALIVRSGLEKMKEQPAHFQQFNPSNGWGSYIDFVTWVERYLEALEQYPKAEISVSR